MAVKIPDTVLHVQGRSLYVDDIRAPQGLLHGAVFTSPLAHGHIRALDATPARAVRGVRAVFTARDIPGENQVGNIIKDEPLLAEQTVHYIGQPMALVVADSPEAARRAARCFAADIRELPAVFDPRAAAERGEFIVPPRTFALGDVAQAFKECNLVVEGRVESGGQEHVYLETQSALAIPEEGGRLRVYSSNQNPSGLQRTIAWVLGMPMHRIEVEVLRLGGGFGGKEDQATVWACLAALAAAKLQRPVKIVLRRNEDMRWTGKRHPYSADFRIGLSADGRILAYQAEFYQNAGAAADLSPPIMERTLFHTTNSYSIPNVRSTVYSCRTNFPPNTAFRGFGAPQALFVLECAIFKAAEKLGVDAAVIQRKNLLKEGDEFPYGQRVRLCQAERCWETARQSFAFEDLEREVRDFNASHTLQKKGMALMPLCFGIAFTNTTLNQASAVVHIYTDGSLSISTGAVEMGQGVNAKIRATAATVLSIDPDRIRVESTSTARNANTSPTAASSAADLNGHAARQACLEILGRLKKFAADRLEEGDAELISIRDEKVLRSGRETGMSWESLIREAYLARIGLSAHSHYATPGIGFDKQTEKGHPFAYHVFGTAVVEVLLDALRGTYRATAVRIVHDCGQSLNPVIDRGQIEGGMLQGLAWVTLEELCYTEDGRLLTDSLTTYKIPDLFFTPDEVEVRILQNAPNPDGLLHSKAVGEPPFMYGLAAYFAALKAMQAFRPGLQPFFSAPLTHEKVLSALYT
jgi:xanthine dehydrogenase large subunit